ncbi:hypothetical protein [Halalkalibacter okhensis]|uniref:hypothetical protein n=1 Tax=Halalkalibacter okhensis TaxID=333138 RepID=UPI001378492A|nr:hypothetical protein [Halalkalibacter okhensis]
MNIADMTDNRKNEKRNIISSRADFKRTKSIRVIVEELNNQGINAQLCKRNRYVNP